MLAQTKRKLKRSWKKFVDFFPFVVWEISARMEEVRERRQRKFKNFKRIFTHIPDVRAAKKVVAQERRKRFRRKWKDFFRYRIEDRALARAAKRNEKRIKRRNNTIRFWRYLKDLPAFLIVSIAAKLEEFFEKKKKSFKKVKRFFPDFLYQNSIRREARSVKRQERRRIMKRKVKNFVPDMVRKSAQRRERAKRSWKMFWKDFKPVRCYTFLRFLSVVCISTVFSTIVTFCSLNSILVISEKRLLLGLCIAAFFALVIDFLLMRRDYRKFASSRTYHIVNFVSHGAFAVVNIISSWFLAHTHVYAYMFGIMKLLRFTPIHLHPFLSAVVMNAVLLISIFCAKTGIKWLR